MLTCVSYVVFLVSGQQDFGTWLHNGTVRTAEIIDPDQIIDQIAYLIADWNADRIIGQTADRIMDRNADQIIDRSTV